MAYQPLYATLTDSVGTSVHSASKRGTVEALDFWISADGKGSAAINVTYPLDVLDAGGVPKLSIRVPRNWNVEVMETEPTGKEGT